MRAESIAQLGHRNSGLLSKVWLEKSVRTAQLPKLQRPCQDLAVLDNDLESLLAVFIEDYKDCTNYTGVPRTAKKSA